MQLQQEHEEQAINKEQSKGVVDEQLSGHRLSLTCVCIDSNNDFAFTGSKDGSIIKWSIKANKILGKIKSISLKEYESNKKLQKKNHTKHINCLAISSDNKFLASGGWDKHIRIWNPSDLTWLHTFTQHKQEITALAFRKGNPMLYSGSADRAVILWTLEDDDNRCYVESLYGHESPITSIDALRRERVLTSGGRDQTLRVWKIVEQAQTVFESQHESVDIARLIDDQLFVSGGEDGTINVWTTMKRSPIVSLRDAHKPKKDKEPQEGLSYWITSIATHSLKDHKPSRASKKRKLEESDDSGEDVLIAKYGDDDENSDDEQEPDEEKEDVIQDNSRDISSSNKSALALIATGSCDNTIRIWKLNKCGGKYELILHQSIECPGFVNDLCFTSDGSKLAAACGQEHRFGRWWKLRGSRNNLKMFDVNKT